MKNQLGIDLQIKLWYVYRRWKARTYKKEQEEIRLEQERQLLLSKNKRSSKNNPNKRQSLTGASSSGGSVPTSRGTADRTVPEKSHVIVENSIKELAVKGSFREEKVKVYTPKGSVGQSTASKESALSHKSGSKKTTGNTKSGTQAKVKINNAIMNL